MIGRSLHQAVTNHRKFTRLAQPLGAQPVQIAAQPGHECSNQAPLIIGETYTPTYEPFLLRGFGRNFSFSHSVIADKKGGFYGAAVIPGETSIWPLPPRRASCDPGSMPPCLATASPFAGFLKIRRLVCLPLWCTLWWCGEKPLKCRLSQKEGGEKAAPAAWGWSDRFHTGNRALLPSPSRCADAPRAPPPVILPDANSLLPAAAV